MKIEYVIEIKGGVHTLYSIVPTKFFGKPTSKAKNFICEGTEEYCKSIKAKLEKL